MLIFLKKIWYFVLVRTFTALAFWQIFGDPDFYSGVIAYFVKEGSAAGGFSVVPSSGNPFGSFSPSAIMGAGECAWKSAYGLVAGSNMDGTGAAGTMGLPDLKSVFTVAMPVICMAMVVYALSAIMALTLFMTALEAYIVMNAGVILIGFAGSSWTMGFWNKYLSYVGGIAIRLFVMCLILGLVQITITKDLTSLNAAALAYTADFELSKMSGLVSEEIKMVIDVLILTFLVVKVPAMAGSMLTGTVNSGLGDVIAGASMMLAGAGMAAGLSKMGINMGGGGAGGGAKEAFKDTLRGNGAGNTGAAGGGGSGASSTSSGGTRTASQTAKSAELGQKKAEALSQSGKNFDPQKAASSSGGDGGGGGSGSNGSGASTANVASSSGVGGNQSVSNNGNSSPSSSSNSGASNTGSSSSSSSTPSSSNDSASPSSSEASNGNSNSGGISGANNQPASGQSSSKSSDSEKEKKAAEIMKNFNKHKDNIGRNFNKLNQDNHAGATEVVTNLHKD